MKKYWLILVNFVIVTFPILLIKLSNPTVVYARMGSTGGGHISMGHASNTHIEHYTSSSSANSADSGILFKILVFIVIGFAIISVFYKMITGKSLLTQLRKTINTDLSLQSSNDETITLLTPNLTLDQFNDLTTDLAWDYQSDFGSLTKLYADSQFDYSQAIRDKLAGKKLTDNLANDLYFKYYYAMLSEIKDKVNEKIVDDVIVSKVTVLKAIKTNDLIILHLKVTGQDREVAYGHDFDNSYEQETWQDYVIYKDGKIANIVYGGHFHLNGIDFNHQETLGNYDFEERNFNDESENR